MSGFSIVNRYVKAILSEFHGSSLDNFIKYMNELSSIFSDNKFVLILTYPTLKSSQKAEFILNLMPNSDVKVENFIKLLSENSRLGLIPEITKELNYRKSLIDNIFYGVIKSNFSVSQEQKNRLESELSKKFNAKIILDLELGNYNGIKVEIDGLGVETGFSMDNLRTKITEYILKAI